MTLILTAIEGIAVWPSLQWVRLQPNCSLQSSTAMGFPRKTPHCNRLQSGTATHCNALTLSLERAIRLQSCLAASAHTSEDDEPAHWKAEGGITPGKRLPPDDPGTACPSLGNEVDPG